MAKRGTKKQIAWRKKFARLYGGKKKKKSARKGARKTTARKSRKGSRRKTVKKTSSEAQYLKVGRSLGWDMGRWQKAKKDTLKCASKVKRIKSPMKKMIAFNRCRRSKKLR